MFSPPGSTPRSSAIKRAICQSITLCSAALLEHLGFEREGYARDYLMINGRWEDHILTALLNPAV
ncbi:hypothetical protein [Aeromonas salmonicida]|uniref:hypothetical protein n=1 Tax=Aeromonas salmonicida TaxID=645 RepID=UPI00073B9A51|nr:hypothetical protein VO70_06760 [Aeromonas salmonicida]